MQGFGGPGFGGSGPMDTRADLFKGVIGIKKLAGKFEDM